MPPSSDSTPCQRPVAFVTGSSAPRLGRSVVERFAQSNYRVVVHAHHSIDEGLALIKELEDHRVDALLVVGSVANEIDVACWIQQIDQKFGRLDVVVHCSAIWEPKSLEETTAADVRHFLEVNLLGSFLVAQQSGLYMANQVTGGSIILIGDWAIERPYRDFAAYFTSKGGIPTLVKTMAVELASRNPNMRVNAILPGPVLLYEGATQELESKIRHQSLLKRTGTKVDIAEAAIFLAEQPFITGVCLPVDGGRTIFAPHDQEAIAHPLVDRFKATNGP